MAGIMQMLMAGAGTFVFQATISANTLSYNLHSAAVAAGWDGVAPIDAQVTIDSGVVVGATNTSTYAFDTGASFPAGSELKLVNNGYIVGAGGAGRNYNSVTGNAGNGGPALRAQAAISITNNGTIGGGGGGGDRSSSDTFAGGGGGAGYPAGSGGSTQVGGGAGSHAGYSGTLTSGGGGGLFVYDPNAYGMAGGSLGASGGEVGGNSTGPGVGGAAVTGNSFVTWTTTGTRLGSIA